MEGVDVENPIAAMPPVESNKPEAVLQVEEAPQLTVFVLLKMVSISSRVHNC